MITMTDIRYVDATLDDLQPGFLKEYRRRQEVRMIAVHQDGEIVQKPHDYVHDWGASKRMTIEQEIRATLVDGGYVTLAYEGDTVVGFASLDASWYPHRVLNMPLCHVSEPARGKGVGRTLFARIVAEAGRRDADKLYVSSHPDIHTVQFYQRQGCVLTTPIPHLFEQEPNDIHMERKL